MSALLVYLLKANVVLALFALAYYGLLRRLTFFGLNRIYLVLALVFAAVYPALPVPALLPAGAALPLPAASSLVLGPRLASPGPVGAGVGGPELLAAGVYALGAALLLLRLLGQLLSLALVRARARPAMVLGQLVRVLPGMGGPFSFGRTIYLSQGILADEAGLRAAPCSPTSNTWPTAPPCAPVLSAGLTNTVCCASSRGACQRRRSPFIFHFPPLKTALPCSTNLLRPPAS